MSETPSRTLMLRHSPWIVALLVGALVRILSYIFSANNGGDAIGRVGVTAAWLQHPNSQLTFGTYPPGHFWLIAAFAFVFHDVVTAGRMLSLVLGIGSLFVGWRLARTLYGDTAALLSLVVFSFYTIHIAYSTTSSSEVSYLFFLLLAMYLFFASLSNESKNIWLAGAAGISLSVAASIRYEAWIFFFGMSVILIFSLIGNVFPNIGDFKHRLRSLFVFGLTGGFWPAGMMAYCWRHFGDPMYLVTLNHQRVHQTLITIPSSLSYQLGLTPAVLAITLSVPVFAAALYGLWRSFTSSTRLQAAFAMLILLFAAVQTYEILSRGLLALARYTLTLGTLLVILSGFGVEQIFHKIHVSRPRLMLVPLTTLLIANAAAVLALGALPNRYQEKFASVSPVLSYPKTVNRVAEFLRTHVRPQDAVVVDDYNAESNILAYAAGLPLLSGQRTYLANTKYAQSVRDYVAEEHPQFMVYSDQGTLRQSFASLPSCNQEAVVNGIRFHCVFSDQIYRVYQLSYQESRPNGSH